MKNRSDEREAQAIIEKVCPKPEIRQTALAILAEAVKEANVYGRDKWTVRVEETARLLVGRYYVCTIHEFGVWIALDDDFMKAENYYPTMDELSSWGWVPDKQDSSGYRNYKDRSRQAVFSVNGYYSIGAKHGDAWLHIRRLFHAFIYKAMYYGQRMDRRSPDLHSPGMLKYMRHYLGVDLPDPLY